MRVTCIRTGGTTLKMKQLEFSDCFFFYIWIHLFTCAPEIIAKSSFFFTLNHYLCKYHQFINVLWQY